MWKRVPFGRSASVFCRRLAPPGPSFERPRNAAGPPGLFRDRPRRLKRKSRNGRSGRSGGHSPTRSIVTISKDGHNCFWQPDSKVGGFYAHDPPASRTAAPTASGAEMTPRRPKSRRWTKIAMSTVAVRAFRRSVGGTAHRWRAARGKLECQRPQDWTERSVRPCDHHSRTPGGGDEQPPGAPLLYREWRESTVKVAKDISTVEPCLEPGAAAPR
jgi:hypothetical protein